MTVIDLAPRYELLRELGRGGMGSVFLVRDLHLGKDVALKLLRQAPATREELETFQKEFALLSEIEHAGIARAHDFGYAGDRPYFTAEHIAGETLADHAGEGRVDSQQVLRIAVAVAEALSFLHKGGILHLDIKPSNIIVPEQAASRGPVIIDFGLFRRSLSGPPGPRLKGSLPYMAPEWFGAAHAGPPDGTIGPWTDVYAFGVTLYRLLTGRFPRRSAAAGRGIERDPAPCPPSEAGAVPRALDPVILKCLAIDPRSRYRSAGEVLEALRRLDLEDPLGRTGPAASISTTVGRISDLARAERLLDAVGARTPFAPVILLTGPPGAGQSHFLREIKVRAQTRGIAFYLETGYPGRATAPGSLLRCLGEHVADREARARWDAFLSRLERPRRPSRSDVTEKERRLRRAAEVALAARCVSEPLVIAADGLQHFDEVSIGLFVDLARLLGENRSREGPPIGIIAGCRDEGTSVSLIRELTARVLEPGRGSALALGPLGLEETLELYRARGGGWEGAEAAALLIHQRTGGIPGRIVALAAGPPGRTEEESPGGASHRDLDRGSREVLLTLAALDRPAEPAEISSFTRLGRRDVCAALRRLDEAHLALATKDRGAPEAWVAAPSGSALARAAAPDVRRHAHARVARGLLRSARGGGAKLVEAIGHFRAAGDRPAVARHGLAAVRYLKDTQQNRAALDVIRAVLVALPRRRRTRRIEAALEGADLSSRTGNLDEGIRVLRECAGQAGSVAPVARARLLLHLASLHSRRGDFRRAESLFREGLAERGRRALAKEERLFFLNEHAAMKAMVGEYGEAMRLCEEGLRLAGRSRRPSVREVALNLHATRANVALRVFDFERATKESEKALEIAAAIGSPANQAAVLNNLGIVYGQCDRYEDAVRAFREAERTCLEIDEGPSLVSLHGNLAVLYSKTGNFLEMDRALEAAERLAPAAMGRRQEFFHEHARGLCLLNRGRPADARARFEAAIRLGGSIGDRHVVAFDEVYRAECLILEAAYDEAGAALERLAGAEVPARVRKMAFARLALLGGFSARPEMVQRSVARWRRSSAGQPIGFLDAWDGLYIAWAYSLAGSPRRAVEALAPAQRFFRRHGLAPALSLAAWVRAEARFLEVREATENDIDLDPGDTASDITLVLQPLLAARAILGRARSPADTSRAADLLAEAGAVLAGNTLPEWEARLAALNALLRPRAERRHAAAERRRKEIARRLPEKSRKDYLQSAHWKAWTRFAPPASLRPEGKPARPGLESDEETGTVVLPRTVEGSRARSRLVARSRGMRRVLSILDRLRASEVPVLIHGETGSGKELIARAIHEESRRSARPFRVIECAAIPPALFEAEIFGARRGAFTDLTEDRPGILAFAAGGTVLLDEVAGVPLEAQAKLLRVLSEGTARRLGDEDETRIDVRFMFSTSHDLDLEVSEGRLRPDFLHRIRVVTVDVPSLRDRPEDLSLLIEHLLREGEGPTPSLGPGVLERLRERPWPGNVRELENLLARLRLENPLEITLETLEAARGEPETTSIFPRNLLAKEELGALKDRLERDYIAYHFRRLGGDAASLGRFLGLSRRQLQRRLARLGLTLKGLRAPGDSRRDPR